MPCCPLDAASGYVPIARVWCMARSPDRQSHSRGPISGQATPNQRKTGSNSQAMTGEPNLTQSRLAFLLPSMGGGGAERLTLEQMHGCLEREIGRAHV